MALHRLGREHQSCAVLGHGRHGHLPGERERPRDRSLSDHHRAIVTGAGGTTTAPGVPWLRYTALATGILSVIAGFLAVRGSDLANQAIYHSKQAVLFQASHPTHTPSTRPTA